MKIWLLYLFLFFSIIFAHVAKTPVADRPVRYEYTIDPNQDSVDSAYWRKKSDSVNLTRNH